MRILGADLRELGASGGGATLVALDPRGAVAAVSRAGDLAALARELSALVAGEPFLLAVDVPVASTGPGKPRRVDGWVRRRLGVRIPVGQPDGGAFLGGS